MNQKEAMEYIESITGRGIVPGLDSITALCERLGNPQENLKFVHVAGTNGKGSVCAYIGTVLQCAGYKVGRYVSPTIFDYRERIQVNQRMITKEGLGRLMEQVKQACDAMVAEGMPQPTPFEVETALGFLYFVEKGCDIVILETGMGGLTDATNLVSTTVLSVITSISMDHMQFLGNTLSEIAGQKAGIMKPHCPVVTTLQEKEAQLVLEEKAKALNCPIRTVSGDEITGIRYGLDKQSFGFGQWKKLEISLAGTYQIENAALAVAALEALEAVGFPIKEKDLRKGLLETRWPGRFTVLGKKPFVIADGAHNEDAARRLAQSIEFYFTNRRIIYIMGVLKDKEYEKVIALTHSLADQIITVSTPNHSRALPAYELAQEIAKVHPMVTAVDSLEEAVEMSHLLADKDDCIIAFGSLSFLGRLMELEGYGKR